MKRILILTANPKKTPHMRIDKEVRESDLGTLFLQKLKQEQGTTPFKAMLMRSL
jgi:hypothetical protein